MKALWHPPRTILIPGNYTIYVYVPMAEHAATTLHYTINNGSTKNVDIPTPTQAEGQTSGEWITPGTYKLPKGNKTTVTPTGKDTDGIVVADAVLFVPEK